VTRLRASVPLRRRTGVAIGAVAAVAAFCLYYSHASRPFGYDEAETVGNFVRQGSLLRPFTHQIVFNNHPMMSFLLVLVGSVGGYHETAMRLLPALLGAATVGVFAWWADRRYRWPAAIGGAAVLATVPLFVEQARQARGYMLIVFCALVASIVLVDDVRSRAGRVTYVAAIAIAVATHLYAGLVVLAHAGYIVGEYKTRRWRLVDLAIGVAVGALAYVAIIRKMLDVASYSRGVAHPDFPRLVEHGLLGERRLAMWLLLGFAAVCAIGLVLARRRDVALAFVLPAAAVLWVWKVNEPQYLYARFLVAAALPLAAAVAWTLKRVPALLPVALLAAWLVLQPQLRHLNHEPPVKQLAQLVDATRARGLQPCAFSPWALGAYTELPPQVREVGQADGCDVIVQVGGFGADLVPRLRDDYRYAWRVGNGTVLSQVPRAELEPPTR
jgi:4-amino-4-deoxy-L-arabinose transferase-like glycosyltransferase